MRSLFRFIRRASSRGKSTEYGDFPNRPRTRSGEPPTRGTREPPLDLYREDDVLVLECDVPGVTKRDLDVEFVDGQLRILGERRKEKKVGPSTRNYRQTERLFDTFERSVSLPEPVRPEQSKARYDNGVLTVRLPRAETGTDSSVEVQ